MANVQIGTKSVGSIVKVKINGSLRNFIVVHQGLPSSLYDNSCNGTWLLMETCFESRQWHSSDVNAYASSAIHTYLNATFLNQIDPDIRNHILQAKIPYSAGNGNNTVHSGSNGLPSKVFILSSCEVGYTNQNSTIVPMDGDRLSYFYDGADADAFNRRIAYLSGSATIWWLRSMYIGNSTFALRIRENGSCNGGATTLSSGIRPAFILPATLWVSDDGIVTTNTAPTIHCDLTGDLGEKNSGFTIPYSVNDEDGDTVTVTEAMDGIEKRTYTATLGANNSFAVTGEYFMQLLNGPHTMTITAKDQHGESAVHTLTFTKAVHALRVTLEQPLVSEAVIVRTVLSIARSIPDDAEFQVLATSNALDEDPVWEDVTASVLSGRNHLFENEGTAFNFAVTAARGESGEGGYISSVGGAFE